MGVSVKRNPMGPCSSLDITVMTIFLAKQRKMKLAQSVTTTRHYVQHATSAWIGLNPGFASCVHLIKHHVLGVTDTRICTQCICCEQPSRSIREKKQCNRQVTEEKKCLFRQVNRKGLTRTCWYASGSCKLRSGMGFLIDFLIEFACDFLGAPQLCYLSGHTLFNHPTLPTSVAPPCSPLFLPCSRTPSASRPYWWQQFQVRRTLETKRPLPILQEYLALPQCFQIPCARLTMPMWPLLVNVPFWRKYHPVFCSARRQKLQEKTGSPGMREDYPKLVVLFQSSLIPPAATVLGGSTPVLYILWKFGGISIGAAAGAEFDPASSCGRCIPGREKRKTLFPLRRSWYGYTSS